MFKANLPSLDAVSDIVSVFYVTMMVEGEGAHISLAVTAILARTISSGYVSIAAVVPAREPARKRGKGGRALKQTTQLAIFLSC